MSRYYFAKKELDRFEYDIVHLNSSVLTDWLAPSQKKAKVVIHIQEPFRKGNIDILHNIFRLQMKKYADKIIAISQDNANRVGLPEKTEIIYNYAEVPKADPKKESYSSKKFLYLGGSSKIKGFYTLVKALDYLDKDIKIYFGGNYTPVKKKRTVLKQLVKYIIRYGKKRDAAISKMQNHPNATEIGLTHNVNKYLDEVCCLISPFSVSHFTRPVIEAHLHQKPVIGSDVKGMDEIITNKKNGLIFKTDDAKELAKAINYMANHAEEAKQMGEDGYNVAKLKFTSKNINQFEKIYASI